MPNSSPVVANPAQYVTPVAIGTTDADGRLSLIRSGAPLPVAMDVPAGSAPLNGTIAASGKTPGFVPANANPIVVELRGTWAGSARLVRSTDGGATVAPLKIGGADWAVFTGNGIEQAWSESERNVSFHLDVTLTSGTLVYRISQ